MLSGNLDKMAALTFKKHGLYSSIDLTLWNWAAMSFVIVP